MTDLLQQYKQLVNVELPRKYQQPVRFNHCFGRIILDWLFKDCWYNHLDRKKIAVNQLTFSQLQMAVQRMKEWILRHELLVEDNNASLIYRKKYAAGPKASTAPAHPAELLSGTAGVGNTKKTINH